MKTTRKLCRSAAVLLLALGARTALADQGIAYAIINPNATVGIAFNPSGGNLTVTHPTIGSYAVGFPNSGIGVGWSVIAAAFVSAGNCSINGWASNQVFVLCFNSSGAPVDSSFDVLAVSNANDKGIFFALADKPATASYAPNASYSYNPNGAINATRSSAGTYNITFSGWSASGGTVQIGAYGGNATCYSGGWTGSFTASVNCIDPSGNPVDSEYVIYIVPAGLTPPGLAFTLADQPSADIYTPAANYSYNSAGGTVTVNRESTGQYLVTYASLGPVHANGGEVLVTAYGSGARCYSTGWSPGDASSFFVEVDCVNSAGGGVDSEFEILALPPSGYAYALITDATAATVSPVYTVNLGGAMVTATHNNTGNYSVTFPHSGIGFGWSVHAAAYGGLANYCKVDGWGGDLVTVLCFTSAGVPANTPFTVLAVSNTNGQNIDFAFASQPTVTSYAPDPRYSYNSAGTITITRAGTGTYSVVFNGLDGSKGTVQVTALGVDDSHCFSDGWATPNFTVSVVCANPAGARTDSEFTIAIIPPALGEQFVGYALADQATTASYTPQAIYSNNAGGRINVSRRGAGTYQVTFTGLNAAAQQAQTTVFGGDAHVTSLNSVNRCHVAALDTATQDVVVDVNCYNLAGALADTEYVVLVFQPLIGAPSTIRNNGVSPQSTVATTQFPVAFSVQVTDINNVPVANVEVTFTAPGSGPSGTFDGSTLSALGLTNASGIATAPAFTANSTAGGPYTVLATIREAPGTAAAFTLTNTPLTSVTLQTSPAGLLVSLDGNPFTAAPLASLLVPDPTHTIATSTPQAGLTGVQYVWLNWSDSLAISHSILVPAADITYTASFQTQYQLTIAASPAAGGIVTPPSGTYYNPGTVVPVTATVNAGYTFNGWSGPVVSASNASTTVTMSAPEVVIANFSSLTGVTIQTNPPGLQFTVDGGPGQTAPQTLNLSQGTHNLAVQATQTGAPGTQFVFSQWSDLGALSHNITVSGNAATYTASFVTQYFLNTAVSPAGTGSVAASPSPAGYYNAGTSVQLTASANPGFQFSSWSGDLSGSTNPQSITMNAPHSVIANFTASSVACSLVLGPPPATLPPTGTSAVEVCPNGSGQPNCGVTPETARTFTVTPSAACGAWTATSSNPGVLQITAGASGSGAGSVAYTLLTNTHTSQQSYTIAVVSGAASASYTVTEAGSGDSQVYREVYALYEQLLGRDPDAAGFGFWTGTGGAGLGQMADSFLTSPEAFNTDFAAMVAYQAATGAPPTYAQFAAAVASIRAGTQTVPGLFSSLTGPGYNSTTLYQNLLQRTPTSADSACIGAGLAACFETIAGLPSATTPVGGTNNEFQSTGIYHTSLAADHSNGLFIQMIYYVTVSRDPDVNGLAFWTGIANSGGPGLLFQGSNGFATRIQILGPGTPTQGFIGSPEFQALFAN